MALNHGKVEANVDAAFKNGTRALGMIARDQSGSMLLL